MLMKKTLVSLFILCFCLYDVLGIRSVRVVKKKEERRVFSSSENGEVTGVKVSDGRNGTYHLQFITMESNALFLPVLLHADMLFYVHSGSGSLSWIGEGHEDETVRVDLQKGDVYRLKYGTVFFIKSNLESERQKLRIYSIFATPNDGIQQPSKGPYSSIRDMLLGFDEKILLAAFKVPEEVIEELKSGTTQPLIVHGVVPKSTKTFWEVEAQFIKGLMGSRKYNMFDIGNKKQKRNIFNILTGARDVENCNGWSTTVTRKNLKALKGSDMGIFMVNLTKGSMMGPHWNPMATEISIVVQGQGMVRVVCSSGKECENARFRVGEGDVFVVPRFHPMAQMSFNNDTFVFVGFSTVSGKNHPQFLAGKSSVLQTLERDVLATSFNVPNTTIDRLLAPQSESIILECTSCAEGEERMMEEKVEREREEARKREEEKKREEEEEKREKEEEARKREEARRKEEEARREEEEEARRKEEEKRQREKEEEDEARREREEEEASRKEEEKRRREKEEEEEARTEKEEVEEAGRKQEEKRKREEQEEEEARRREKEEEEEARREKEEEEVRRKAEEKRRREKEEEGEARREKEEERRKEEEKRQEEQEEKEVRREKEEEEARREKEEEEARQREEEKRRQEEEEEKEARQQEEETRRREEEEEETKRQEEEAEVRRREEEEGGKEGEQVEGRTRREEAAREEEEAAKRQEEEREREGQHNKKRIEEKGKKIKKEFIRMW